MTELPARAARGARERFAMPRLELIDAAAVDRRHAEVPVPAADGEAIETVAIPDGNRMTLCISSQAGCALQCAFCATGAMGFSRNLEPFEIAGQVREMRLLDAPRRADEHRVHGHGRAADELEGGRSPTLTLLNDPRALGIGARHITISTVGVLPGIVALGERPEQFRLAISIHAPIDELRRS